MSINSQSNDQSNDHFDTISGEQRIDSSIESEAPSISVGDDKPVSSTESEDIIELMSRSGITSTQKVQLVQARIGQGGFRQEVYAIDKFCPVTKISDVRLLIASHIKPWCESSDFERLDPNNGIMLSPHLDCLFDRGLISFRSDGTMLVAKTLDPRVLAAWGIDVDQRCREFSTAKEHYLMQHRRLHGFET